MFESIRNHQRLLQFLLLLLIFPAFAFFGLSGYDNFFSADDDVAVVAESPISAQEFENARRSQIDNMRRILGDQIDPAMFDNPAARKQILEGLIDQRLLAVTAQSNRLTVADSAVRTAIQQIPGITNESGAFDFERYKTILAAQGLNEAQFEASVRADLALQLLPESIAQTAFTPALVATRVAGLNGQKRTIRTKAYNTEDFIKQVELADGAARKYYDENPQGFQSAEAATINYLVLDEATLANAVELTDAEVEKYYQDNERRFGQTEQRRARHILIEVPAGAADADKTAALDKAQALVKRLRDGESFEELAKSESDDPGSANAGGDLGYFDRSTMTEAFAEAAFALQKDEISEPVETEFGVHIIQVTEIKPESVKPLAEVRDEIEQTLRSQKARSEYLEQADIFNNTVYEQPDSLAPAAEKLGLKVQELQDYRRVATPDLAPDSPLLNPKVARAIFDESTRTSGMNTEAIDTGNNVLVAARVLEYRPAKLQEFAQVEAQAEAIVRAKRAAELAAEAGKADLEKLNNGDTVEGFGDEQTVSRATGGLSASAMDKVFELPADNLPARTGVAGGTPAYQLIEVVKVEDLDAEALKTAAESAASNQSGFEGQQALQAWLTSVKEKTPIERFEDRIISPDAAAQHGG